MKTHIKKMWKGMLPVRDKFARVALMKNEDLIIHVDQENKDYVVPFDKLKYPRIIKKVPDNFSNNIQELLYYGIVNLKEDKQAKLL